MQRKNEASCLISEITRITHRIDDESSMRGEGAVIRALLKTAFRLAFESAGTIERHLDAEMEIRYLLMEVLEITHRLIEASEDGEFDREAAVIRALVENIQALIDEEIRGRNTPPDQIPV